MSNFDAVRKRIAAVAQKQAKLPPDRADDLGVLLASLTGEIRAFDQFSAAPGAPNMTVANAIIERLCKRADVLAAAAKIYGGAPDPTAIKLAAKLRPSAPAIPSVALDSIRWSFQGSPYASRSKFISAVTTQQRKLEGDEDWEADEIVIPAPTIDLQYFYYSPDHDYCEPTITLTAADEAGFRAGELLHLIHNAVVDQVKDSDHHFFEGLQLVSESSNNVRPTYRISQGS